MAFRLLESAIWVFFDCGFRFSWVQELNKASVHARIAADTIIRWLFSKGIINRCSQSTKREMLNDVEYYGL